VTLQAMACGAPVVASAVGGMLDTVVDEVTGRWVAPKNPRACADAIHGLVHGPSLRAAMGRAGRQRVCERYSWDRVADDTERIYRRVLSGPAQASTPGKMR